MARSRGIDETIGLFRQARRDAVSLWTAKWHVLKAGQEKFSKSSKEFQAIDRLCCWGPAERIRSLADGSACRFADRHGDDLFRGVVDGTQLNAVTKWFYGTLPKQIRDMDFNRIKRFSVSELLLLDDVNLRAQAFITSVGALPLMDPTRLRTEVVKWNSLYAKARETVIKCSPACQGFMWLVNECKLPHYIAVEIAGMCGDA